MEDGSQADEAGIEAGDLIVEADGKAVHNVAEFTAALGKSKDKPLLVLLKRGKQGYFATLANE